MKPTTKQKTKNPRRPRPSLQNKQQNQSNYINKNIQLLEGPWEMAQQLGVGTAFAKDWSSVPSTNI